MDQRLYCSRRQRLSDRPELSLLKEPGLADDWAAVWSGQSWGLKEHKTRVLISHVFDAAFAKLLCLRVMDFMTAYYASRLVSNFFVLYCMFCFSVSQYNEHVVKNISCRYKYVIVDSQQSADYVDMQVTSSECKQSGSESCTKKPLVPADRVLLSH